jgi:hypothetical protein
MSSWDPSTWNSATQDRFTLGQILQFQGDGKFYIYVRNYSDAAIADGDVCVWQSATSPVVTGASRASALGGATTAGGPCAGVGVGVIDVSKYGFLLAYGLHVNVKGVATVTLGRKQRASSTAVSGDNVANAYDSSFGVALTAPAMPGRYTVFVNCLGGA